VEDLSLIIWRRTQEAERERLRSERALIKKKRKFSLIDKEIQREQLQSHI
jgi:hypothetical protein